MLAVVALSYEEEAEITQEVCINNFIIFMKYYRLLAVSFWVLVQNP